MLGILATALFGTVIADSAPAQSGGTSTLVVGSARGQGTDRIDGRVRGRQSNGDAPSVENRISGSCVSTRPCLLRVFLDDKLLTEEDDWIVRTWDLSGVEYYTGASMPARYRVSGSACGVLLLWSKWR